jgi:hypothetical protein
VIGKGGVALETLWRILFQAEASDLEDQLKELY